MGRLPDSAYRAIGWFSSTRFDRVLHPILYRWSGGRGVLGRVLGCEMILLSTTGRRSGRTRTVALFAFAIPGGWAVIGSRGGSGRIPAWYRNLEARREATVQVRDCAVPVVSRDADGEEYEHLFELASGSYPGYRLYRAAAAYRIPIVALERADATARAAASPHDTASTGTAEPPPGAPPPPLPGVEPPGATAPVRAA